MKKLKFIIPFLILFIGTAFPQFSPKTFLLSSDKKLAKTNSASDYTPAGNSISDIVTIGDTIWVGTGNGLSRSTDGGSSWTNFYGSKDFGTDNIAAIGYNHGTVWVSTAVTVTENGSPVDKGTGLKYTTDNGANWTSLPQPIDAQSDSTVIYGQNHLFALPVTVPEQNLTYDIAFTPNTVWVADFAGGLRKSTDMGKTWQRVVLPPDYLDSVKPSDTLDFCMQPVSGKYCSENNLNYRVFSVISTNDSTLYVGTADGINKSTDNGISWVKFNHQNQTNPISGNFIVALAYNQQTKTVWSASWQAEGQTEYNAVSASSDGGQNWNIYLEGEKVHNFAFKGIQTIAPSDNGAYRTQDNGQTWILPTSMVDAKTGLTISTPVFNAGSVQGNIIWLGSDNGLARLNETGGIWQGTWKIYFASKKLSSTNDAYAYPNPFSPKIDNQLKIKYSTGGKSEPVTIRIFDFGMHYVRTVIQNAQRGNPAHSIDNSGGVIDYWDGRDAKGSVVPNGVYFYRIDVGSSEPIYGKILVLQ